VGEGKRTFIIAEVGVNHNGDPHVALEMIDTAADAGVDCVKFQTFHAEEFINSPGEIYEYNSQGRPVKESMLEMFRRLELKREDFARLFTHARKRGLIPLSTPTDREAVDLLDELGAEAFKIGSDDLVYTPFLEYVGRKQKPVILSTGMARGFDIDRALRAITGEGNDNIILLHCVSLYPTPEEALNLRRIQTLGAVFDFPIGFSDHSSGTTACIGAVALGACVLEKHFTLNKDMAGPDHWFSADPNELASLVREVRRLERALGGGALKPSVSEQEMARLCRRSIVAGRDLPKGHCLSESDLAYQRPGTGLPPYDRDRVLGRRTMAAIPKGTILKGYQLEAGFAQ